MAYQIAVINPDITKGDEVHIITVDDKTFERMNKYDETVEDLLRKFYPMNDISFTTASEFKVEKLTAQELLEKKAMELFRNATETGGKEPDIAEVEIEWKDGEGSTTVFIALQCGSYPEGSPMDEKVFFYTDGIDDLIGLMDEDGSEDFFVTNVYGFYRNEEFDENDE